MFNPEVSVGRFLAFRAMFLIVPLLLGNCASPASTRSQPVGAPKAVLPFDLVHDVPVIRVTMNGAGPYNFILDTGANPSAVDLGTARAAGVFLDESRSGQAEGAGDDRVPIFAARIDSLRLGNYRVDYVEAVAVDLSAITHRLGIPLHGVLGYSLLAGRVVRIDYPQRTIEFLPPGYRVPLAPLAPKQQVRLPLEFPQDETIPLLGAFQVNGHTLPVTLDTGSSLTLEIAPADAATVAVRLSRASEGTESAVGARGGLTLVAAEADSIGIASLQAQDVTVHISPRLSTATYRHGNLGNGFLKQFILTLDYAHNELILERPSAGR